jgi:hypothetical protein
MPAPARAVEGATGIRSLHPREGVQTRRRPARDLRNAAGRRRLGRTASLLPVTEVGAGKSAAEDRQRNRESGTTQSPATIPKVRDDAEAHHRGCLGLTLRSLDPSGPDTSEVGRLPPRDCESQRVHLL